MVRGPGDYALCVADVLGSVVSTRTFLTVLGGLAFYKGIEALVLGAGVLALPMLLAGVATRLLRPSWAWWGLAVASLVTALGPLYRNHVALLFWVALACALFPAASQRQFVLKAQLTIVYGFGALGKLWGDWLSGDVLVATTWIAPFLPSALLGLLIWGTIALEIALAVGVWRDEQLWWWIAVALHISFVLFIWIDFIESIRLVVFGILMLSLWLYSGAGRLEPQGRMSRPRPSRLVG